MGKMIDITNQKFGKLTAIEPTNKRKNRNIIWKCKCECGNLCEVSGVLLRQGNTKSCGCLRKENAIKQRNNNDIIGKRFERLVVIKPSEKPGYWQCKCDCGNYVECKKFDLEKGKTKSCGCLKKEEASKRMKKDITGQKFGKLTAIKELDKKKNGHTIWLCQCECGSICKVQINSLTTGNTRSCGCVKSHGEQEIKKFLQKYNIQFEQQKTFETCRFLDTNALARFDFYLPEYNILIEYDGIQHFQSVANWDFIKQKEHDEYKNQWCEDNNIKLIRIPYTKQLEIDTILKESIDNV